MWVSLIVVMLCLVCWGCCEASNPVESTHKKPSSSGHHHEYRFDKFRGSQLHDFERSLATKEIERMQQVVQKIRTQGYQIQGFYHVSTWKDHWAKVITEQLRLLDGHRKFPPKFVENMNQSDYSRYIWDLDHRFTSILNITNNLYMNVAVEPNSDTSFHQIKALVDSLNLRHAKKISMHMNRTVARNSYLFGNRHQRAALLRDPNLSEGEFGTITALTNYCQEKQSKGEKAMVYYFHSKGSCCWKNSTQTSNPVAAWRDYMNALTIEFPSICIRALLHKYAACGTQIQDAHFSGNFWWADCEHVVRLPPLVDRYDFMGPETFILNGHSNTNVSRYFGFQCGYSTYHCNKNLYLDECPRAEYLSRIARNVFHHQLLPNYVSPESDNAHVCYHWRNNGKSYAEQAKDIEDFYKNHMRDEAYRL